MGHSPPNEWCGKHLAFAIVATVFYALPRLAFDTWKGRKK